MERQDLHPSQLLEISGNYWRACTLHAGVKLDLFTFLGNKQLTSEEISQELNGEKRGVTPLLNALTAMDILTKDGDIYSNTKSSATFLSKESPQYIGHIIIHHSHLVDLWQKLDQSVKTGKPLLKGVSDITEEWREGFLMGMFNMAMMLAPMIVNNIDLSNKRHMLDLGGGPGTYAIHFCLKNPQLKATVYDFPTTRPFAKKAIERFDLANRIDFIEGNYIEEDIKGSYDVIWLSHILHGEGPDDCQKIIKKAVEALESGGMIMIHDFLLKKTMDGPVFPALFSLNMLLVTPNGQAYSEEQIIDMLDRSGVKEIKRIPLEMPNDSGVITGVVNG
ncbi:MAG: methyltransferase [Thermodesulfobacteriota bacterium]|nr:methyltransferase [Thermodesulfobacteriota bacterium]